MRVLPALVLLGVIASPALAADTPAGPPASPWQLKGTFFSPMGEPFRPTPGGPSPDTLWFQAADTNRDGRLTMPEFRQDAMRFFTTLDVNHDGEIDPTEMERYETQVAPEVRAMDFQGKPRKGEKGADMSPGGRYGYFDIRQPVSLADTNLNRGVSAKEFDTAAVQRFRLLDEKHEGYIALLTLPEPVRMGQAQRKRARYARQLDPSNDTRADE
ncbi:hypothetical protein PQ455_03560 [Sphingomonas naphthae]|uniref:EF-hand domain-containing protein n=1 Tax=Sphingomonas naphthae TaxID=1813468 RepID=A0ABY7TR50_9SPHN|nr:hypothetical protein [Sphingomonas naphthae]WCT74319.1 hypothetical protein PQ455_03560 [Sphingomonas naphthae]